MRNKKSIKQEKPENIKHKNIGFLGHFVKGVSAAAKLTMAMLSIYYLSLGDDGKNLLEKEAEEDAREVVECGYFSRESRICTLESELGLDEDELLNPKDTERPNILAFLPVYDNNDAIYGSVNINKIYRYLLRFYDVSFVIAENESDIYKTIAENRHRDIAALIFDMHSNWNAITLSLATSNRTEDDVSLDIFDDEVEEYLNMLPKDSMIIFLGCNTANEFGHNGRFSERGYFEDLVDYVAQLADGRIVIGSKDITFAGSISFNSIYPLEISFINPYESGTTVHTSCSRVSYDDGGRLPGTMTICSTY